MHSKPLPRISQTPSQPPFSHCLSLLLPFFPILFSTVRVLAPALLILTALVQVCPWRQQKKGWGIFLVGLHCSPGKSQEIQTPSWGIPMLTGNGKEQTQPRRGKSTKFKLSLFGCGWWAGTAVLWERKGGIKLSSPPCLSPAIRSGYNKPTRVGASWLPAKPRWCPRGGKGKANRSSRIAGVLETRKTLSGDTCIRCFQTITKPA